jgi:hypothetical protein
LEPQFPTKRTTPEQWEVIAWAIIILFVVLGAVGLYFSYQAPADKPGVSQFRFLSFCSLGVAAAIYVVKRVIGQYLD